MKKAGRTFLSVFLLCCCVFLTRAQVPVISTPDISADRGTVVVPVQTSDFQNLTGLQFLLSWNPRQLKYLGVQNLALDIEASSNFGTTAAGEGILRFLWFDRQLQPAVLPDGATLFELVFESVGLDNETQIVFGEDKRTRIEVYDEQFENIAAAQFKNGVISFSASAGTAPAMMQMHCTPNPFSSFTRVDLSMKKTTTALIRILDMTGKMIHEEHRQFQQGAHSFVLDSRLFPAAGTYFLRVQAPRFTVTQKMIFL